MPSTTAVFVALATLFTIATATPVPNSPVLAVTKQQNAVPLTSSLPSASGLTLAYIALGHGTQNYTCASAGATPVAIGARADLYDATFLAQPANKPAIATLPALSLSTDSGLGLPTLGHHYFTSSGVPTFVLDGATPKLASLSAKKVADVPAPNISVPNSVDWLFLNDNGKGSSTGLKAVYRVETAGGVGKCTKAGEVDVKYSAEYWFYN